MALSILELLSGDTSYISKHNTNYANIKAAIEALQAAIGSGGGGGGDNGTLAVAYEALFGGVDCLIGYGSYLPSDSATSHELSVASGYAYHEASDAVVTKTTATTLNFLGQSTGTYYTHVDGNGQPYYDDVVTGSLYSVYYNQSTGDFSEITRTGNLFEAATDQEGARSNLWGVSYPTVDGRIDGVEKASLYVLKKTVGASNLTLTDQEAYEQGVLILEDGPQSANVTLTIPEGERIYTVVNDCGAGYTVQIGTGVGTSYALAGGYFAILHCDAVDTTPLFLLDRTTGVSPISTFIGLSDTPGAFAGYGNWLVRVNSGASGLEFYQDPGFLTHGDVDDVPVDGADDVPVSSNWAYDHANAADPHPGYLTPAEADVAYAAAGHTHSGVYEPDLGDPASDGYVLSSTAAGVRSWVEMTGGGGGGFSAVTLVSDQASVNAAVDTLYIVSTGATNPTCTVNLPVPDTAGKQIGVIFLSANAETDSVAIHPATGDSIRGSTSDVTLGSAVSGHVLVSQGDSTNWYLISDTGKHGEFYFQADEPANSSLGSFWVK